MARRASSAPAEVRHGGLADGVGLGPLRHPVEPAGVGSVRLRAQVSLRRSKRESVRSRGSTRNRTGGRRTGGGRRGSLSRPGRTGTEVAVVVAASLDPDVDHDRLARIEVAAFSIVRPVIAGGVRSPPARYLWDVDPSASRSWSCRRRPSPALPAPVTKAMPFRLRLSPGCDRTGVGVMCPCPHSPLLDRFFEFRCRGRRRACRGRPWRPGSAGIAW